ncbi:MAG TPA: Holliday junction resolvase RuvX [Candidatus Acidoferrales bacterium]|nr:Holliday junction resolvase RuvX [Candidatus Acidoferrales bacterium]
MSAVLALDVGSVRIGVAVCEGAGVPAVPLATLVRGKFADDVAAIVRLAAERNARTLVVGYPIRLDGSVGPAAAKIDRFIAELGAHFDGEIVRQDERLTTASAQKKLRELDLSGSKRRQHVDAVAAVEILNSYLAGTRRG